MRMDINFLSISPNHECYFFENTVGMNYIEKKIDITLANRQNTKISKKSAARSRS